MFNRRDASQRTACLVVTATSLVVLVAMARGVVTVEALATEAAALVEGSSKSREPRSVRAMAAVVAAAARDLLGNGGHQAVALLRPPVDQRVAADRSSRALPIWQAARPGQHLLAERLIDLPPPSIG